MPARGHQLTAVTVFSHKADSDFMLEEGEKNGFILEQCYRSQEPPLAHKSNNRMAFFKWPVALLKLYVSVQINFSSQLYSLATNKPH